MAHKPQQLIDELDRLAKAIQLNRKKGREILFELMLILPHRQYLHLVEQKTEKRG